MHLAFLIGDDWYISDQTWTANSATFVAQTADLEDLTFFLRTQSGLLLPDGGVAAGGDPLPAGLQVIALGFWWDGPKTANSRVDTVTLIGPTTVDLIAGQTIDVGSVSVREDGAELIVTITTDSPGASKRCTWPSARPPTTFRKRGETRSWAASRTATIRSARARSR